MHLDLQWECCLFFSASLFKTWRKPSFQEIERELAYDAQTRFKADDFDHLCCWKAWHQSTLWRLLFLVLFFSPETHRSSNQATSNANTALSVVLQKMRKSARPRVESTFLSARTSTRKGIMIFVSLSFSRSNSWQCFRAFRSANRREGTSIRQEEINKILSHSLEKHSWSQLLECSWILISRWEQLEMIVRKLMRFISACWSETRRLRWFPKKLQRGIPFVSLTYPRKIQKSNSIWNRINWATLEELWDIVNRQTI